MKPMDGAVRLTDKIKKGELLDVNCASRDVLKDVTSLWGVMVLLALRSGTHRFSELRRKSPQVSEKMLTQTLHALETDGFINRVAYPVVPPKVEYSLTELGIEVTEHLSTLVDWIELNLYRVMASREKEDPK